MGKQFGNLCRIIGITYYTVSPHEQRALAGVINPGIKNVLRRTRQGLFLWGIPMLVVFTLIKTANEYHHQINRKNPEDFAHEV